MIPALAAGNAIYFLQDEREWVERIAAVVIATLALGMVVRPLVEGALVARWEGRHPNARLFRLTDTDDEDAEKQLYVSTHPLVAA